MIYLDILITKKLKFEYKNTKNILIIRMEKKDSSEKYIPIELLINIISFLPIEYTLICRNVCMSWLKNLKSNFSKKILPSIPKNVCYIESLKIDLASRIIVKIRDLIYVSDGSKSHVIDIKNFKLLKSYKLSQYVTIMSSNDKYFCLKNCKEILVFEIGKDDPICTIPEVIDFYSLAIDNNNNICISTYDKFYIYNLEGKMIRSWNLVGRNGHCSRKIEFNKNEIYMVDTPCNRICVFSYEGTLIRSWGSTDDEKEKFLNPWGITIHKDIVYVADSGNKRIQAFTCYGKFIFEYKLMAIRDISDIIIINDHIYIGDWIDTYITKFKLIYK